MSGSFLTIAMLTEVFTDDSQSENLHRRLVEARAGGAELAVLPELPVDPWMAGRREPDPTDAEDPGGRRHELQAEAARRAGVAVLGGAIIRDPETGRRYNTALLFDNQGSLRASYRKIHLPFEDGFWEAAHYEPGNHPPDVISGFGLPIGIQICSDANRTTGSQQLACQGAAVIIVPRATPKTSWERWRLVLRANAVTTASWVVTVNRTPGGGEENIGGPSAVIAPDGTVVASTTDPVAVVRLDGDAVARARADYPGYLDYYPKLYRKSWEAVNREDSCED